MTGLGLVALYLALSATVPITYLIGKSFKNARRKHMRTQRGDAVAQSGAHSTHRLQAMVPSEEHTGRDAGTEPQSTNGEPQNSDTTTPISHNPNLPSLNIMTKYDDFFVWLRKKNRKELIAVCQSEKHFDAAVKMLVKQCGGDLATQTWENPQVQKFFQDVVETKALTWVGVLPMAWSQGKPLCETAFNGVLVYGSLAARGELSCASEAKEHPTEIKWKVHVRGSILSIVHETLRMDGRPGTILGLYYWDTLRQNKAFDYRTVSSGSPGDIAKKTLDKNSFNMRYDEMCLKEQDLTTYDKYLKEFENASE